MTAIRLDDATVEDWVASSTATVREVALAVRALVLDVLPDVDETAGRGDNGIGFGANQYGANGWGVMALAVNRNWVSLGFFRGTSLDDPVSILEGTGKNLRHVKIRSMDELTQRKRALTALIRATKVRASEQPGRMAGGEHMNDLEKPIADFQPAWDAFVKRAKTVSNPPSRQDELDLSSLYHDLQRANLAISTAIGWHRPLP